MSAALVLSWEQSLMRNIKFWVLFWAFVLIAESSSRQRFCHCEDKSEFKALCNKIDGMQGLSHVRSNLVCLCLCPGRDVQSIRLQPSASKTDRNMFEQVSFLNEVTRHPKFIKSAVFYFSSASVPLEGRKHMIGIGQPLLSSSFRSSEAEKSSTSTYSILIPDHLFIRNRGYEKMLPIIANFSQPFEQRQKKCYWRGSTDGPSAVDHHPTQILRRNMYNSFRNLSWAEFQTIKPRSQSGGRVSLQGFRKGHDTRNKEANWLDHRCLIDIDGNSNAKDLIWKLASGSVVFKVESNYSNAYIQRMKPFVHYIPISSDLSDFAERTKMITDEYFSSLFNLILRNAYELSQRHTYEKEINRVVNEIQSFVRYLKTAMIGFKRQFAWSYDRVNLLLDRLNATPRVIAERFQGRTVRYSKEDYEENFPDFVLNMFTSHPKTCFPLHAEDLCPIFAKIPHLPTHSSPLECLNESSSTPLSFDSLKEYYGPENAQFYKKHFYDQYNNDKRCNYDNYYDTKMYASKKGAHNVKNTDPDCPNSKHLIFTLAENYHCNKYSMFLRSLRESKICADLYIVTSKPTNRTCGNIELSCGKVMFLSSENKYREIQGDIKRFLIPLEFLNEYIYNRTLSPTATAEDEASLMCTQVLITDFGDVFFQRNPFTSFMYKVDAEVVFTEESYDQRGWHVTINNESTGSNSVWTRFTTRHILGSTAIEKIGDMPVVNCGVTLGTLGGVYKFIWAVAFLTELQEAKEHRQMRSITQQSNLVFLIYSGLLSRVVRYRVLSPASSVFINAVYYHPSLLHPSKPFHFQTNPVTNQFHEPYAIVHMYNRFHMMTILEDWILSYGGMDWKFDSVAPARMCKMNMSTS